MTDFKTQSDLSRYSNNCFKISKKSKWEKKNLSIRNHFKQVNKETTLHIQRANGNLF